MNYIKMLESYVAALKAEREQIRQELQVLRIYLQSEKFQGDDNHWVNPDDVLARLPIIYPE